MCAPGDERVLMPAGLPSEYVQANVLGEPCRRTLSTIGQVMRGDDLLNGTGVKPHRLGGLRPLPLGCLSHKSVVVHGFDAVALWATPEQLPLLAHGLQVDAAFNARWSGVVHRGKKLARPGANWATYPVRVDPNG